MNAIDVKNVSKTFKDFKLDDVSLLLPEGCVMGLIGENGSGKTTLIKLILNALFKESGSIEVLGNPQNDSFSTVKEDIGVVFDTISFHSLFNSGDIEKIMSALYKNWDSKRYKELLETFKIPLKTQVKDLSKGSKMKLSIACALSHNPRLLILDEPTSGLDPVAREDFLNILWDFTRDEKHSVLISSHIVSDLEKICDYITFLHEGKVILSDEKDEILSSYGIANATEENFKELDRSSYLGYKKSPYGVEVLINKKKAPAIETAPASLEEIFIYTVRGEE